MASGYNTRKERYGDGEVISNNFNPSIFAPFSNLLLPLGRSVDRDIATRLGLAITTDSPPHIILAVGATGKLSPTGPGRKSIGVRFYKQFSHNTVLVADILSFVCLEVVGK